MRGQSRTVEEKLRPFADAQHGLVTRAQLLGAGVSSAAIERRLRNGTLLPEYPGIYRVGHRAPNMEASYLAAVLACGKGSLLSGRAAGHLLGLLEGAAPEPEVTMATERRVEGIRTRRSRRAIDRRDAILLRAIPVTTVPRTLVDLAAVLPLDRLARACHEAGVLHGTTPAQVELALARRPNSPGTAKLRRILRGDVHVTLSKLERRFLELLHEAELPLPQTNRAVGGRRVDCPLAQAATDSRARQLPLPPLAPRLGAGPPSGARSPRTR
jgi:hypothetical protein